MNALDPVLENTRLAAACGADPAMALAVALASAGPLPATELFRMLDEKRGELERILTTPGSLRDLPSLEPELRYEPELARMHIDKGDHEVRGQMLFRDLLGKKSFFQVAALEIGGVELSERDAELLSHCGVVTQLADPRIWPLTVVRRIAARGGGLAAAFVGGMATLVNRHMTVLPVAGFMNVLDRLEARRREGHSVAQSVDDMLARREKIPGVGRPVIPIDERVGPKLELLARYGRADGPSVSIAREVDSIIGARKGLRVNSAGFQGALLRDLGFTPAAGAAFSLLYFVVPVLAHAVYAEERRRMESAVSPAR